MSTPDNLAEALPKEIDRVREVQDGFKALRQFPNTIVEPQIAMIERSIQNAIRACANGDVVEMLRAYQDLKGWTE
jgi:hypothetical protein